MTLQVQVKEETGLDISSRIRKDDYIEVHLGTKGDDGLRQQRCKLFIVQGVGPAFPTAVDCDSNPIKPN